MVSFIHVYMYNIILMYHTYTPHNICDRACENQPCEHKLHRVVFLLISSIQNVVSHFCKFQKKAH